MTSAPAPCCAARAPEKAAAPDEKEEGESLRPALVAAGLGTALVMLLSLFGPSAAWLAASVTVLTLLYAGRPFFLSALSALRRGRSSMDVPVSLALLLTTALSLFDLSRQGGVLFFDSVTMLLFVLLVGRHLDDRARRRAREAAQALLAFFSGTATILEGEQTRRLPIRDLAPGMVLSVAAGEKIGADGEVSQGVSDVDLSIITGETIPQRVEPGRVVFGGATNLSAPLHVRVTAASEDSLLSEIARLMQKAEQGRARFVRFADRVAGLYTPVVLGLSVLAFLLWFYGFGLAWPDALSIAASVLVITCPCAMALAVPAVQILAAARLFRQGVLLKSADALERLAAVDTVVFDKTGTLTLGRPKLANRGDLTTEELKLAASLAAQSRHPMARAALAAHGGGPLYALDVSETPGQGLEAVFEGQPVRLGRREWCGPTSFPSDAYAELWLRQGYKPPRRLAFADGLREDAVNVVNGLRKRGLSLYLLSGDREEVVAEIAAELGIEQAYAHLSPLDKCAAIENLRAQGRRVLMVGDGLNDAPALAAADVSFSPSTALDITQNAADLVFQGAFLAPVLEALVVAERAQRLSRENIALSVFYNVLAVPLALAGQVSPLIAAAAMSLSSLAVVLNAQRMRK